MNKHEPFELKLTGMASGGSAVGRHEGRAIFVPYGIAEETVRARITRDKGRFAQAEIIEIVEAAPERVRPPCKHFGVCGGCQWQHIDYAAQLAFKHTIIEDQMRRIGGFADVVIHPTIASPQPWHYRAHATFQVGRKGVIGFVGVDGRTVIPIEECHIVREGVLEPHFLNPAPVRREGEKAHHFREGERLRVYVSQGERVEAVGQDDDGAARALGGVSQVHYTVQGRRFQVSAGSFFQVNIPQAETLVRLVLERLALTGSEHVLDLYSGVGLFTAFLAEKAASVTAVESFPPAVRDALDNLAEFDNVTLVEGAVEEALAEIEGKFDACLIDPPRAGMDKAALAGLIDHAPGKIVYVSCDPATLARDAKRLAEAAYRLIDVQPVDMFPQTFHIEAVAAFEK